MRTPPFHANNQDNKQCAVAALRIVLEYFRPDQTWSEQRAQEITDYVNNKAVWPQRFIIQLIELGLDVKIIESFDLHKFSQSGYDYLLDEYGEETANWQRDNAANLELEQARASQLLEQYPDSYIQRVPTINDIKESLNNGCLAMLNLNSKKLANEPGYIGHIVVAYDYDDESLIFHDPGLPPVEARRESFSNFEAAWSSPNDQARFLITVC